MVVRSDFQVLYCSFDACCLMKKKDIDRNLEARGNNSIIVRGMPRTVKWKSQGAGWYKVFTVEMED